MQCSQPLDVEADQATRTRTVASGVKTRLLTTAFGFGCFVLGVASVCLLLPRESQQQPTHHGMAYAPIAAPLHASLQNARVSNHPSMSLRAKGHGGHNNVNRPPAPRVWKRTSMAMGANGHGVSDLMARLPAPQISKRASVAMSASADGSSNTAYKAASVQAAWDNHFEAFGMQDVARIMLDYNEDSVLKALDHTTGKLDTRKGMTEIQNFFEGLFEMLSDTSGLVAPVIEVTEGPKQVYLVWSCPTSGIVSATDTFMFDEGNKIRRQNIAFTSRPPEPAPTLQSASDDLSLASDRFLAAYDKYFFLGFLTLAAYLAFVYH